MIISFVMMSLFFYDGFMFLHRVHELYMFYYTKDGFLQHKTLPFAAQKATF